MHSRQARAKKSTSKKAQKDDSIDVVEDVEEDVEEKEAQDSDDDTGGDDKLGELVENLTIKSAQKRILALRQLSRVFSQELQKDFIMSKEETLKSYLTNCIKSSTAEEVEHAGHLLSVIMLSIGSEGTPMHRDIHSVISPLLADAGKSAAIRASIVRLAGISAFVGNHDDPLTNLQVLAQFETLFVHKTPAEVLAPALESWSLVATSVPGPTLIKHCGPKLFAAVLEFLEHKELSVRTGAGQAIVVIYNAHQEGRAARAKGEALGLSLDIGKLTERLEEMVADPGRRVAKKDKAAQRSLFRDILSTIEDDDAPSETLRIDEQKIEFEGWNHVLQLDAVRTVLGKGLPQHLKHNEFLQGVFGYELTSKRPVEKSALRDAYAQASKAAKIELGKQRSKKTAQRHGDDDD